MSDDDLAERIASQFSYASRRADVWRAFDVILPTDRYLNLGYSRGYQTHLAGSPQRRLVDVVANELLAARPDGIRGRLLDVGCGRGGPTAHLSRTYDFDAVGIDLVPYNVSVGRKRTAGGVDSPGFAAGDATQLPFRDGAFTACVAIDSLVYVPDRAAVFGELARVLGPGGLCVVTDLVADNAAGVRAETFQRFADAWDMPPLSTLDDYREQIRQAGFRIEHGVDISANSVRRFRKWSRLYLALADGPTGPLVDRLLGWLQLDSTTITEQIRAAHRALPALRHVLLRIELAGADGSRRTRDR